MRKALLLALLFAGNAHAGKLADGVFGIAWGEKSEFPKPDGFVSCTHRPEVGFEWACQKEIGGVLVVASLGWKHKMFHAAVLHAEGFSNCDTLMKVLTEAWGRSTPKSQYLTGAMDDRSWLDGKVAAIWEYNKINNKCTVAVIDTVGFDAVQQIDKEAAKAASSGI